MTRYAALVVAIVGCGAPRSAPIPPAVMLPAIVATAHDRGPRVVGRVTLDGEPVPYFGVVLLRDWQPAEIPLEPPVVIRDSDGRFDVPVQPGRWKLAIAGFGFARQVTPVFEVTPGAALAPLAIEVTHGRTIEGTVTYTTGNPIEKATVTLGAIETRTKDPLWERAVGHHSTLTDARGRFRFYNIAEARVTVHAQALPYYGAALLERRDADDDRVVDLVVLPVGSIAGRVVNAKVDPIFADEPGCFVMATRVPPPGSTAVSYVESATVAPDGTFRIDDLPIGEYRLMRMAVPREGKLDEPANPPGDAFATVEIGKTTTVSMH